MYKNTWHGSCFMVSDLQSFVGHQQENLTINVFKEKQCQAPQFLKN
jgi:hypothetical protein